MRGLTLPISSRTMACSPLVSQQKTKLVYHMPPSMAIQTADFLIFEFARVTLR